MITPIRILVVDDHPLVRYGLSALLKTQTDMQLVGEADDGVQAVSKALALQPDVILLDLALPKKDGVEVIHDLAAAGSKSHILVLTSFAGDDKVFPAIKGGALGYLLKDTPHTALLQAIRDVYRGEISLHPTIARKVIAELHQPPQTPPSTEPLTQRELTVLEHVAQGLTNQQIAQKLDISQHTVHNHVNAILRKLHLANRTQAALYAAQRSAPDAQDDIE